MVEEKDFYRPGEIVPTVFQLTEFILPWLDELRMGCWPRDYRITGYTDSNAKSPNRNTRCSFLNAAELAAEIDFRLSRCVDSIMLILAYTANPPWTIEKIAQSLHYDEEDLRHEMRLMLKYIAGRQRKGQSYPRWKADRKRKDINYMSFNQGSGDKPLEIDPSPNFISAMKRIAEGLENSKLDLRRVKAVEVPI